MKWLKKPLPAALLLVFLWTGWRLVLLQQTGIPQPKIHDEFSYLLGADTFAHGRLANPTPALPVFFESPHLLMQPTYASKYPPGQAMFLALGQRLFGSPFYGVLIGNAFMLFAFCLMLYTWVPYQWALAVSTLLALCLEPGMYWTNSYFGGSVAASGGALVLLGVGLYRTRQSILAGTTFAVGGLLLLWTRPFEGGIFTLTVLALFAVELWRKRRVAVFLAALSVFSVGVAWTGYYNWSVTGNPALLPYLLHDHRYNVTPVLSFLPLRPEPVYSTPRLAAQHGTHGWETRAYRPQQSRLRVLASGFVASSRVMIEELGIAALFTMLFPIAWRNPVYRRMAVASLILLLVLSVETFHFVHYGAPVWAALALMVAIWAQSVWSLRLGRVTVGPVLVWLVFLSVPAHNALSLVRNPDRASMGVTGNAPPLAGWSVRRAALIQQLSSLDKPQLVIVRYPAQDWRFYEEWVYNSADIDHQRVILAHDMGPDEDQAILRYYPDRTVSLLTFDSVSGQEHLQPYPSSPAAKVAAEATPHSTPSNPVTKAQYAAALP